jgi:hypothetical protein
MVVFESSPLLQTTDSQALAVFRLATTNMAKWRLSLQRDNPTKIRVRLSLT